MERAGPIVRVYRIIRRGKGHAPAIVTVAATLVTAPQEFVNTTV
jgi:hypothetical protein